MTASTKLKPQKKTQKFVRINLDSKLEQLLLEFENEYKLLNRSDIVRMLLSEIYNIKKRLKRQNLVSFIKSLPKAKHNLSDDEVYNLVSKELL